MVYARRLLVMKKKLLILKLIELKRKRKKRHWVRKVYRDRQEKGEFHMVVRDLRLHDHEYFFTCFSMSPSTFEELISFDAPIIVKKSMVMRDPIGPSERLPVTLRYLVTRDAQCTIAASYRISPTTIGRVL